MKPIKPLLIIALVLLFQSGCSQKGGDGVIDLGGRDDCDSAKQLCRFFGNGVIAELKLGDGKGVGELKPFDAVFKLNQNPTEVEISFIMKDMDMGPNRYRMTAKDDQWGARPILPICSNSRIDWIAELEWLDDGQRYRLRFPFHTNGSK